MSTAAVIRNFLSLRTLPLAAAISLSLLAGGVNAQSDIENVIVETYYVSDANDASDNISGSWGLAEGSRTYRVFLDLCSGCSLRALYGSADHTFYIQSTALIFNHVDRGRTFGHLVNNNGLGDGTAALDSWLSMGAASGQRFGTEKATDTDGSEIGGVNNDGGSALIPGGLLVNADASAGIPLTDQDGMLPLNGGVALPPNFSPIGDDPEPAFYDSMLVSGFTSTNFYMGCGMPGTVGPTPENRVLVAQITTLGELTFELNVAVQLANGDVVRYVARDTLLAPDESANGLLVYPPACGCTDPDFLEYDPSAGCDDGSCATAIVFGCLDPEACNYDPAANFNVSKLCCYSITNCNGLDPDVVCPGVSVAEITSGDTRVIATPNPTDGVLHVRIEGPAASVNLTLLDVTGRVLHTSVHGRAERMIALDLSPWPSGAYLLKADHDGRSTVQRIVRY